MIMVMRITILHMTTRMHITALRIMTIMYMTNEYNLRTYKTVQRLIKYRMNKFDIFITESQQTANTND